MGVAGLPVVQPNDEPGRGGTRDVRLRREAGRLEDHLVELAYHYDQAGVQEKARLYLERAGDKAQAQYANATAEGYYREVVGRLDKLGRGQDAAPVREKLSAVLSNCVLTGNSANWNGGGACYGTLYDCVLMGNSALSGGGGNESFTR